MNITYSKLQSHIKDSMNMLLAVNVSESIIILLSLPANMSVY